MVFSKPAAAAAKPLQSCPTLCNPIDGSPLGSSVPGIPQAMVLEWVAIALSVSKPNQPIKEQRSHFADKSPFSQSYGLFIGHVQMQELDHEEGWALKNWCFLTVVLKTLESPLDCKEIKSVNHKGTLKIQCRDWCWSWRSSTLAIWWEKLTQWKRPWCWERLKAKGEEGCRGWDGWIASPIQWTWT